VDAVSEGELSIEGEVAIVDATAGGSANSADNPFIYLQFEGDAVTKLEITDVEALSDTSWDIALKRFLVRVNGGDSGPGNVQVAAVEAETVEDVSEAPGADAFSTDDWSDEECGYVSGPIGEPATAVGTWYGYEETRLSPLENVYVIQREDGTMFKFAFETYYHDDTSGFLELTWAAF